MPFTPQQLYTEITTDPTSVGYAASWAAGDDVQTAALLNAVSSTLTLLQPVPMLPFAKFAAGQGLVQKLITGQSNATVGGICYIAVQMLGQLGITFDPTDPATQQMLSALVSAGILTSADAAAVTANCTLPCSRAQYLWGYRTVIAPSDVGAARRAG